MIRSIFTACEQDPFQALDELVEGADTLSVAVSYLQVGGWELFRRHTRGLSLPKMRIVCTDQMGITQPAAVERAIGSGVQIRNFAAAAVYHPKVYLAHDRNDRPIRFLVGSANLSTSAFTTSVEAGLLGEEKRGLRTLHRWFNELFEQRSVAFTPEHLREMQVKWRLVASARARNRLRVHRRLVAPAPAEAVPVGPEDSDTIEDVFATIQLPIGLLNIDYARNNVRNITKLREVLANPGAAHSKQRSELKLLGFMQEGNLTPLGRAAGAAGTNEAVARLWCKWLQQTPDADLERINPTLLVAKRVFPQFWRLKEDVRAYFVANAQSPQDRRTLQTIELLCNARYVVQDLSLDNMRTLSGLLGQSQRVPEYIRKEVSEYFDNKGRRSWDTSDRRVVPEAWRVVAGRG
jgi:HKD family nuclease